MKLWTSLNDLNVLISLAECIDLFCDGKGLVKGACLVGEMMKCECYES